MAIAEASEAQRIRAKLGHPVIDADGHMSENGPVLMEFVKKVGGLSMVEGWQRYMGGPRTGSIVDNFYSAGWENLTERERRDGGVAMPHWWFLPTENTLDRATSFLPRLFNDRMDELGIDFSIVYPSVAIVFGAIPGIQDDDLRRGMSRAYNMYASELYGPYADRMTAVAAIPMHTPQEALEELEFAVKQLKLKAAIALGPAIRRIDPQPNARIPLAQYRVDLLALDSDYDYDPVWAKFVELGVAPGFHATSMGPGWGARNSTSNLMYNVMGNFAESGDAMAKALFMGGVTRRFPGLRAAFLEGGVGRGCILYAGMFEWWSKRNAKAMESLDPAKVDRELLDRLIDEYGDEMFRNHKSEIINELTTSERQMNQKMADLLPSLDDWYKCEIEKPEDIKELFESRFYYGCEADDPTAAWAFDSKVNPKGARIRAMLSSDIGHCDVPDIREVLPEAYELLEDGLLTQDDFRDFVFTNVVRLYGGMNPDFFKGTRVEADADKVIASGQL